MPSSSKMMQYAAAVSWCSLMLVNLALGQATCRDVSTAADVFLGPNAVQVVACGPGTFEETAALCRSELAGLFPTASFPNFNDATLDADLGAFLSLDAFDNTRGVWLGIRDEGTDQFDEADSTVLVQSEDGVVVTDADVADGTTGDCLLYHRNHGLSRRPCAPRGGNGFFTACFI